MITCLVDDRQIFFDWFILNENIKLSIDRSKGPLHQVCTGDTHVPQSIRILIEIDPLFRLDSRTNQRCVYPLAKTLKTSSVELLF